MAKTKAKWIQLDPTKPDVVWSKNVYYDTTELIYDAINRVALGVLGPTGATGPAGSQGDTGVAGIGFTGLQGLTGVGFQGNTGVDGQTGVQGITGVQGTQGITGPSAGPQGNTGVQGLQGLTGIDGQTGLQGLTGVQGPTGVGLQGFTGVQGSTGLQGITGPSAGPQGQTGLRGFTGLQGNVGVQIDFNPINRYNVEDRSGAEVWLVSSSTVYSYLMWERTGANLTIFRDSHGHTVGNTVIVRNTNVDYQVASIDSADATSFSILTTNIDGTSGNNGAYSLGFTYAHDGNPANGGVLSAPSGDHSDVQLLALQIRTGQRTGTTYDLVLPTSAVNGAGTDINLSNIYVPDFNVRADSDNLSATAATMSTNISSSYSTFEFGNLGAGTISRFIVLHF